MVCYHPVQGWKGRVVGPSGRRPVVFNRKDGFVDLPVKVPCGQCIGCRLERSRQWAMRCIHEASLHENNSFITLTYSDKFLPEDRSLNLRHFQLFMKRLRKKCGEGIRFYHCGEYGEKTHRPHYHACLFGHDFDDKVLFRVVNGNNLYTSSSLDGLWEKGFCTIGDVTFESAAYVARYIMKKVTGDAAEEHYERIDPETGEIIRLKPEYTTMSRGSKKLGTGGIGKGWFEKYNKDVFPWDEVIVNGVRCKPPKYYDGLFEVLDAKACLEVKRARNRQGRRHAHEQSPARLKVREKVQNARLRLLPRNLGD